MMFIVALYLPWCRYLQELPGVTPQLYADNLKCVSCNSGQLLRAARFTTAYIRLVKSLLRLSVFFLALLRRFGKNEELVDLGWW